MYEILNYHSKIAAIRAYCDRADLTLVLHDSDVCMTDGKKIYLPKPQPEWTPDQWVEWEFSAYHEAGHNRKPTDDIWDLCDKEKLFGCDMQWYLNIIDDFRQEFLHTYEYAGRDDAVNVGRALFTMQGINKIQEHGVPNKTKKDKISGAMFHWTERNRPKFQPAMEGIHSLTYDCLPSDVQGYADALKAYDTELMSCATAEDELELIRKVLREVFKLDDEEMAEAEDGKSRAEAEAASKARGKASGKPCEEGEEAGKGNPKGAAENASEDGTEGQVEATVRLEDLIPDNHDDFVESHANMSIDYEGHRYSEKFYVHPDPVISVPTESAARSVEIHEVTSLANRVRKLLQVKSQKRWTHAQEKGKLSSRSLHNILSDTEDYRIFKQKTSAITLNSAVSLLIDMSGSMGGDKWDHAVNATYNMYCSLQKLRIPTEIIGFHCWGQDRFWIFKDFNEKLPESKLAARFQSVRPGSSNEDAAALMFAAGRLLRRKEAGKHLIVFSDGQPAGYTDDSMSNAIRVAKMIERTSIDLIGVGILDTTVTRIYKKHAVIRRADQLEDAIMEIIKTRFV